jgi:hypothetical protein
MPTASVPANRTSTPSRRAALVDLLGSLLGGAGIAAVLFADNARFPFRTLVLSHDRYAFAMGLIGLGWLLSMLSYALPKSARPERRLGSIIAAAACAPMATLNFAKAFGAPLPDWAVNVGGILAVVTSLGVLCYWFAHGQRLGTRRS